MKEVASAPKGCDLKVIQRVSWQEDKQEYFYKCKRNKDKRQYDSGLNIIVFNLLNFYTIEAD
ncbi:MAG: hypothetical protein QMD06_05325 [Candidatus Altarchaeum sp.]|nr:hypothetical protein [Candidatus Altarchaeum sp.]